MSSPAKPPVARPDPTPSPDGPIPLFDPRGQYHRLRAAIDARVAEALAAGAYVNGPQIAELETALAAQCGAAHAVAVANGTDALVMALLAEGIGPGDAVFVPAFTYVATAGAVRLAGATPVFADVRWESCNLDPDDLERRIAEVRREGRLTPRAVIAVDLYGLPADYDALLDIAVSQGLTLIADAAQSLGARRGGTPVGALAAITTTSFYPTKPLACAGDGGMLFTDDAARAGRWRLMRTHGTDASRTAATLGMNSRLDTLQAAILLAKLPHLEAERRRREALAALYDAALAKVVETAPRMAGCESAWALYTIRTPRRDAVRAALREAGIGAAVYYEAPVHLHPAYRAFGAGEGSLPVAERLGREALSLPLHAELSEAQVERVCAAVRAVLVHQ